MPGAGGELPMSKLRSYMPAVIKRIAWNWKHRKGRTDPRACPDDLLECLRTVEPDSLLLDLGCGAGNLRAALRLGGWIGHFIGVDVSDEVIEVAKESVDDNAEWHVSAIEEFPFSNARVATICLSESIYYVKPSFVPTLVARCRQCLAPGGRIVVRICHAERHREYIVLLLGLGAESNPPIYILNG